MTSPIPPSPGDALHESVLTEAPAAYNQRNTVGYTEARRLLSGLLGELGDEGGLLRGRSLHLLASVALREWDVKTARGYLDESMRFFLSEVLEKEGYSFETASNGTEGLERLRSGRFPVVLMDIKMPRMGGMLAMERMKEIDTDLVVILMTAFGSKPLALEALQKGAYDYFTKPFDLDEMRIVIKRAVERCRLLRSTSHRASPY